MNNYKQDQPSIISYDDQNQTVNSSDMNLNDSLATTTTLTATANRYRGEKCDYTKPLIDNPYFTINTSGTNLNSTTCLPRLNKPHPKSNLQAKVYNFLERPTGW